MTIEEIKQQHGQVGEIGGTISDYNRAHTEITLLAIIDELTRMAEYVYEISPNSTNKILDRVEGIKRQLNQYISYGHNT